jgi:hypothetical protein
METIRKTLGGLFAILGAYYCTLSVLTLTRLPSVTSSWVHRSGDPDFRYDYPVFLIWTAVGGIVLGGFGWRTIVNGTRAARGCRGSWLGLAIAAPLLHWIWFMYRTVGNGVLDRETQLIAMRNNGIWFGAICVAYIAMVVITRTGDSTGRAATQREVIRGTISRTKGPEQPDAQTLNTQRRQHQAAPAG